LGTDRPFLGVDFQTAENRNRFADERLTKLKKKKEQENPVPPKTERADEKPRLNQS